MRTDVYVAEFLNSRDIKPSTFSWYQHKLIPFARACPEFPDSPAPIEAFLATFNGRPWVKHAHYRVLRALFIFICKRHKLHNPLNDEDFQKPRLPKQVMPTLEPQELFRLLESADNLQVKAILTLFMDDGIRSAELAGLRKDDIKLQIILVNGKSGQREVPISDETFRLLALVASQSPDEYVFHSLFNPKRCITRSMIYKLVARHMRKAGISGPKFGGHRIRHAFAKNYIKAGGDTRSLQKIMGHASIKTTEQYVTLNKSDLISKHNQFTPLKLAHRAAQGDLFAQEVIQKAEAILKESRGG